MALKAQTTDRVSLRRLTDVSRALTYARSLTEVLDLTVDVAVELLDASRAVLMLVDGDGLLRIRAARGIEAENVDRFREPLDETLVARLAGLLGEEIRDRFLGVPLVVHGDVIGLLAVRRETGDPPGEDEEWLLSAIADQAAVALESTRGQQVQEALHGRVGDLERRQRTSERAIEILSHDLRSPLNAIRGYAALLGEEVFGSVNERQRQTLERLIRVSRHMETLLDQVLEMTVISSGKLEAHRQPASIDQIVREAVEIAAVSARDGGLQIEISGDEPAPVLTTDAVRLRQVLVNLIDNAVKYSPSGSTVRVHWRRVEVDGAPWTEVAVADEGPGIDPRSRQAIFEPYVRGESRAGPPRGGVGLGLAIALGVVGSLGGQLLLESEVGRGSTFRVRMPIEP